MRLPSRWRCTNLLTGNPIVSRSNAIYKTLHFCVPSLSVEPVDEVQVGKVFTLAIMMHNGEERPVWRSAWSVPPTWAS